MSCSCVMWGGDTELLEGREAEDGGEQGCATGLRGNHGGLHMWGQARQVGLEDRWVGVAVDGHRLVRGGGQLDGE